MRMRVHWVPPHRTWEVEEIDIAVKESSKWKPGRSIGEFERVYLETNSMLGFESRGYLHVVGELNINGKDATIQGVSG